MTELPSTRIRKRLNEHLQQYGQHPKRITLSPELYKELEIELRLLTLYPTGIKGEVMKFMGLPVYKLGDECRAGDLPNTNPSTVKNL